MMLKKTYLASSERWRNFKEKRKMDILKEEFPHVFGPDGKLMRWAGTKKLGKKTRQIYSSFIKWQREGRKKDLQRRRAGKVSLWLINKIARDTAKTLGVVASGLGLEAMTDAKGLRWVGYGGAAVYALAKTTKYWLDKEYRKSTPEQISATFKKILRTEIKNQVDEASRELHHRIAQNENEISELKNKFNLKPGQTLAVGNDILALKDYEEIGHFVKMYPELTGRIFVTKGGIQVLPLKTSAPRPEKIACNISHEIPFLFRRLLVKEASLANPRAKTSPRAYLETISKENMRTAENIASLANAFVSRISTSENLMAMKKEKVGQNLLNAVKNMEKISKAAKELNISTGEFREVPDSFDYLMFSPQANILRQKKGMLADLALLRLYSGALDRNAVLRKQR